MRCAPSWLIGIALLGSGCDAASPSSGTDVYALYRIGDDVLPAPAWPGAAYPLVLADTLTIPQSRGRDAQIVLGRTQVYQDENGGVSRSTTRHNGQLEADLLVVDTCPLGAYCIAADLVYQPFELRFVGDSLVEQVPSGSQGKPRVYGRVSRR